jgi:hypothetical protein
LEEEQRQAEIMKQREEEQRHWWEGLERIRAETRQRRMDETEKRRLKHHEQEKKTARLKALQNPNQTFCGNVLSVVYDKHISYSSGKRSLQITYNIRHNVTYFADGEQYQEEADAVAFLWLHFDSGSGSQCLQRSYEWWTKLTGYDNAFPKDVDEAYEMCGLIMEPLSVSYCVSLVGKSFLNKVCDIDYDDEQQPVGNIKLYEQHRIESRIKMLRKHSQVFKNKMKRAVSAAEQTYQKTLSDAVEQYNRDIEQAQQDYETADALKNEADDLMASYDTFSSTIIDTVSCTNISEPCILNKQQACNAIVLDDSAPF